MTRTRHAGRKGFKIAAAALGLAVLVALAVIVFRPSLIANALKGRIEEVATKSMGRPVTIGSIEAKLFPRPGATIMRLEVAGAPGEPAFVVAEHASATVQLWPLIKSFGKEIRVSTVELEDATVNLVRRKDGSWNYEDLESEKPANGERSSSEVWVDRVAIANGELRIQDQQAAGGTATVALKQIELSLENIGPGQTIDVTGAAALASAEQNVTVDLEVESPLGKPEAFFPAVSGAVELKGVRVSAFKQLLPSKAAGMFTGGIANGELDISTDAQTLYDLKGSVVVNALRLRGEPANGSFNFASKVDPANAAASKLKLSDMLVKGPGVDLGGAATLTMEPMAMDFAVKGPLLDLGELLSALPQDDAETEAASDELLPKELREELGEFAVAGSLEIDQVRRGKLVANGLKARGKLDKGVFALESGTAQVFGGAADLAGTRVDLNQAQPEWSLRAKVKGMDLAQAMSVLSGHQALEGRTNFEVVLDGAGADWENIRTDVSGDGTMQLLDGALTSADIGEKLAPALAAGLSALGKTGIAGTVEKAGKGTQLKDLKAGFIIRNGFLSLNRPIVFRASFGEVELGGKIALDQRLELVGKVTASPAFVTSVTRGLLKSSVPLPLTIGGTLRRPDVKPGSTGSLAKSLARNPPEPVRRKVDEVKKTAEEKAKQGIGDALNKLRRRP